MAAVAAVAVLLAVGGGVFLSGHGGTGPAVAPPEDGTPSPPVVAVDPRPRPPVAVEPAPVVDPKPAEKPDEKADGPEAPPVRKPAAAPAGMVAFAGGAFQMGRASYGNGKALDVGPHEVKVEPFALARTEVTTGDYKAFSDATGTRPPWPPSLRMVEQLAALPVVDVSVAEAEKFCQWRFGAGGRLPTEAEWEFAARGGGTRLYPFGKDVKKDCINAFKGVGGILQPVGQRGCGATPEGIQDLVGNAAEWTSSDATLYPGSAANVHTAALKVARGGSFASTEVDALTATARQFVGGTSRFVGFRCAVSL